VSAFNAYAKYYDLLYRDKDYQAEAIYVHEIIQRHAPGARSILDLGCGTGAHAAQFAELGYQVYGLDSSEWMLKAASDRLASLAPRTALRLQFSKGDIRNFRVGQQFDVVTALFHVISYQVTNEDLSMTLANAADHLDPGGILLFDCWYGPAVLSEPPSVRVKRLKDSSTSVVRISQPVVHANEHVVEVNYEMMVTDLASRQVEEICETHRLRYLFLPEIERALQSVGFVCDVHVEWRTGAPLSSSTWYALIVARRIGEESDS
jgi:SAM-dependent methyltransferase